MTTCIFLKFIYFFSYFRLLSTDFRLLSTDFRLLSTEFRILSTEFRLLSTEFRLLSRSSPLTSYSLPCIVLKFVYFFVYFQLSTNCPLPTTDSSHLSPLTSHLSFLPTTDYKLPTIFNLSPNVLSFFSSSPLGAGGSSLTSHSFFSSASCFFNKYIF